jgi:DNA-binding MarR family transcriptional regulator
MATEKKEFIKPIGCGPYPYNFGKLIRMLRVSFDNWALARLAEKGYGDFKMGYMPFLMNIGPEGSTNKEIAERARVTKQAMSKVIRELEDLGYIKIEPHCTDKRCQLIMLKPRGEELIDNIQNCVASLMDEHEALVGKQDYKQFMETLNKLHQFHMELEKK